MDIVELKKNSIKPNIFEYDEYRAYLRDLYLHYKETTNYFSYRYFSKRAQFSSPNFLKLVIEGDRNISTKSIARFSGALKLNKCEAEFFSQLVLFCQSKNPDEKIRKAKEILKSRTFKSIHPLKQAEMQYYSKWYYVPIRELVGTSTFKEDLNWISRQFNDSINTEDIKEALASLQFLGLIERNEHGFLEQKQAIIYTQDDLVSTLLIQYHKNMIRKAEDSIDEIHHQEREISGTCITCSAVTVKKIKTLVREFRKELLTLADSESDTDRVYQLNFQLFPLAGVAKSKSGKS